MNRAYLFPGQGFQYVGMGKTVYDSSPLARDYFEAANDLLGYRITDIMFHGPDEKLFETQVVQNAIFLVSLISALKEGNDYKPSMVAGHSLGETTALVANGCLSFEDGLMLMNERAVEMENAFRKVPAAMVAVLGLEDRVVERVCDSIEDIVVPANYNCPGQLVISGSIEGIDKACVLLKEKGAKRALKLPVGGAFHSPLMQPASEELQAAINATNFKTPICPVYQNVNAYPQTNPDDIKQNLIAQLTAPVRWTQTVKNMITDGADEFIELGPGDVLKGLVKKINPEMITG